MKIRCSHVLACGAVAIFVSILGAVPAAAHSVLLHIAPAAASSVTTVPESVSLTFNEQPRGRFSVVHVTGPDGERRDIGAVRVVDDVVSEQLAGSRPAGRYVVDWRVVSADGHPVSGQFTFTARSAAPALPGSAGTSSTAKSSSDGDAGVITAVVAGVLVVIVLATAGGLALRRRSRAGDAAVHE